MEGTRKLQDMSSEERTEYLRKLSKAIRFRIIFAAFACVILILVYHTGLVPYNIYGMLISFFVGGPLWAACWLFEEKRDCQKALRDMQKKDL